MIPQAALSFFKGLGGSTNRERDNAVIAPEKVRRFFISKEPAPRADFPKHLYRDVTAKAFVDLHGISAYFGDRISMRDFSRFFRKYSNG